MVECNMRSPAPREVEGREEGASPACWECVEHVTQPLAQLEENLILFSSDDVLLAHSSVVGVITAPRAERS